MECRECRTFEGNKFTEISVAMMLTLTEIIVGVHVLGPIILIKQLEHFIVFYQGKTSEDAIKRPGYLLDSVVD